MLSIREISARRTASNTKAVGIELEIEAQRSLRDMVPPPPWLAKLDDSLRGNAMEYVSAPMSREDIKKNLENLFAAVVPKGVLDTGRTSLHVHVNVSQLNAVQLITSILYVWLLDEMILNMCRPDRRSTRFCLPILNAAGSIKALSTCIENYDAALSGITADRYKYSNVAIHNVSRIGTIEIRGREGSIDPNQIDWVQLCHDLVYHPVDRWKNPAHMFNEIFDSKDPTFLLNGLAQKDDIVKANPDFKRQLNAGLAALADTAFQIDWDFYAAEIEKKFSPSLKLQAFEEARRMYMVEVPVMMENIEDDPDDL